ncbi:putative dehydrogenase [Actinoalloteichus hoggarensis]|uniref:1,5-anhydro-D-fructose reductase n=1 Tax=Actinoalloteichus hoggarensis TaxID=1470176 RepID=A0A221W266_9PSEU|nr:Gfo/Idh/MocA family oxidoreductase [Actinoalloteichus hoggarensis]ASO19872.1 1,5-anhydro-D-fructose reductase [Actinoalloteichus hoggarensis]MBB5919419.1 putative dehydrogenase [Actinoalloteichus hoggarensis]
MNDRDAPLRWGIVSTGAIAATVVEDLHRVTEIEVLAVSSRTQTRAEEFAARHRIPRAYADYRLLLADPDVDVVYIATPHAAHHEVAAAALLADKHVLCEKAFTVTAEQARELVDLARERGRFLMEAMWTRFNPLIRRLRDLVSDGVIGDVRTVSADFGFAVPYDPTARLWDAAQGGGALLDLGVYPVSFAHMLLGEPTGIEVHGSLAPNGVDAESGLLLRYPAGAHAMLRSSLTASLHARACVSGTLGRVDLTDPFFRPTEMTVTVHGAEPVVHRLELDGAGYTYQLREVCLRVRAGEVESPHQTHAETVAVLRTVGAALAGLGARVG